MEVYSPKDVKKAFDFGKRGKPFSLFVYFNVLIYEQRMGVWTLKCINYDYNFQLEYVISIRGGLRRSVLIWECHEGNQRPWNVLWGRRESAKGSTEN